MSFKGLKTFWSLQYSPEGRKLIWLKKIVWIGW